MLNREEARGWRSPEIPCWMHAIARFFYKPPFFKCRIVRFLQKTPFCNLQKLVQRKKHVSATCGSLVFAKNMFLQLAERCFLYFSPFCRLQNGVFSVKQYLLHLLRRVSLFRFGNTRNSQERWDSSFYEWYMDLEQKVEGTQRRCKPTTTCHNNQIMRIKS